MTAGQRVRGPAVRRRPARGAGPMVAGLVLLGLIPLVAGVLRLVQLAGGPALLPVETRFGDRPMALIVHITASAVFALVGAFQFVPGLRRGRSGWHRRMGRVLVGAGVLVATSALWMTLTYVAQPGTGPLLYILRLVFASAMLGCLLLGFAAVRRRDFATHRAWMIRAYAIGLGAGTQVITGGVGEAIVGTGVLTGDLLTGDLLKGAAWVINLAVAEWVIRRPRVVGPRRTTAPA